MPTLGKSKKLNFYVFKGAKVLVQNGGGGGREGGTWP